MNLLIGSLIVFVVNVPFGYWRTRTKRFSPQWAMAIHLPVPLVISVRLLGGIGWYSYTFPLLAGSFFAGQWVGGRLGSKRASQGPTENGTLSLQELDPGSDGHP